MYLNNKLAAVACDITAELRSLDSKDLSKDRHAVRDGSFNEHSACSSIRSGSTESISLVDKSDIIMALSLFI